MGFFKALINYNFVTGFLSIDSNITSISKQTLTMELLIAIPTVLIYDLTSDNEKISIINSSIPDLWKLRNTMTGGSKSSKCCLVPRKTAQINNVCILITFCNEGRIHWIYWLTVFQKYQLFTESGKRQKGINFVIKQLK